jgi:pimeloyl-CoA synthetase
MVWKLLFDVSKTLATTGTRKAIKKHGIAAYKTTKTWLAGNSIAAKKLSDSEVVKKATEKVTNYLAKKAQKSGKNVVDIKTGKTVPPKKQYGGSVRKAKYDT